jgi:hypothetical protein
MSNFCSSAAALIVFGSVACASFAGCSRGDNIRVTGKLVKDGAPYAAKLGGNEPDTFVVDFVGKNSKGEGLRFSADMSGDGSFKVAGADGGGIPKGTYRVNVLHSGFLGAGGDRLKARFSDDKTPLTVELTKNANLVVDVGAGTIMQ